MTLPETRSGDLNIDMIRLAARPLETSADLNPLMDQIGDARFVLLGEATHGTSEYYLWRARLSQRLIQEKGFSFIAVEGDWPDCYRVNRYVKGYEDSGQDAETVLRTFERWPSWMWANWEMVALVEWMRRYNAPLPTGERIGFYGLDVYSLWESLSEVTRYLEQHAPDALQTAYRAYSCFQPYEEDAQAYAYATRLVPESCEDEVVDLLQETQRRVRRSSGEPGEPGSVASGHDRYRQSHYPDDPEAAFSAEQNARVAVGAEQYYLAMIQGDVQSWNIRDLHMTETLERLIDHQGPEARGIVWEHNTHVGDARATPMSASGMVNVGQLMRERRSSEGVILVGFGSYRGSVIAGRSWGAPYETLTVPEANAGTWEHALHEALGADGLLIFALTHPLDALFSEVRGHRAIGVVYSPSDQWGGSYVPTALSRRYDSFLYLEETQALHPLHVAHDRRMPPELYPWGV